MPRMLSNPSYVCHLDWSVGYRAFRRFRRKRVRPLRPKYSSPLLNLAEAAGYLRISKFNLRQLAGAKIPYVQHGANTSPLFFDRADLDAYLRRRKIGS